MGDTLYGYTREQHEYTVTVPKMYVDPSAEPEIVIAISAHGGGTVGESYRANGWDYAVYADGAEVIAGQDLRSAEGRGATHAEMAVSLCTFLAADAETLAYGPASGRHAEVTAFYDPDAVAFLESEGERLGIWYSDNVSS